MKKVIYITLASIQFLLGGGAMASNLDNSKAFFDNLSKDQLQLVDQFYDKDVVFQDPIHQLNGAAAVKQYYAKLYENVDSIRFEFGAGIESGNIMSLPWKMLLKTPAINKGRQISVDGVSVITFNSAGQAIHHRDYFDMGEFVYERVPVLGSIITFIKGKMSGK